MSLAEIKNAVELLPPADLAELVTFVRERENAAWDQQIDTDFAQGGRLRAIADEARADARADKLQDLP